jgi:hypothetical protein
MKLETKNVNYCATIVKIHNLVNLNGLDNLVGFPCFGNLALLSKDHFVGETGVLFTAETQLSPDFCYENSLYREKESNKDKDRVSYLENSRRVKALKLRGNVSTALFMPLSSLSYLGVNIEDFKEGQTFTHINDKEVCRKYIINTPGEKKKNKQKGETKKRIVDENVFKQHIETEFFLRNLRNFHDNDWIIVTEKIHSTSGRFGHIKVDRELKWYERVAKFFGVKVQEKEYKRVCGSRRVVKVDGSEQSFYKNDVWKETLEKTQHLIPKDVVIYSEIVGWDGDKPLQKDYTYQMPQGTIQSYIYRIATVNDDGFMVDWSWNQIKDFCKKTGMKHVPEIWQGYFKDFDYTIYENKKFREELGLTQCLPLDPEAPCSEGVVVRLENGLVPYLTKFKSPDFYLHEGCQISAGRVDIESEESLFEEEETNNA